MLNSPSYSTPSISLADAQGYLQKRVRSELMGNVTGAVLSLAAAACVFLAIFWAAYIFLFFSKNQHLWIWVALVVIAFSFLASLKTDAEYLSQLEVRTWDGRPAYNIPLPGGWRISNINYLHPKTQQAAARLVLQLLTVGPRGVFAAWRYGKRAAAIRRVDPGAIAGMFKMLVERGRRVPYEELAGHALREPEKAFSDLLLLEVAQHLANPPQGMVVSSRTREEVTGVKVDGTDF